MSAYRSFSNESKIGLAGSEIDFTKKAVKLTVTKETAIEVAKTLADKFLAQLVEYVRDSPAYDKERWSHSKFTVQLAYKDMGGEIIIKGLK